MIIFSIYILYKPTLQLYYQIATTVAAAPDHAYDDDTDRAIH